MNYTIELEKENDGRSIAEVIDLPGVIVDDRTVEETITKVQTLALRVVADDL
ncbi:MAG TPA: HicB family protein [Cyanothece sp. UBA12306]|nr:HicB family protein [Cyanothece sp. UBA12306]